MRLALHKLCESLSPAVTALSESLQLLRERELRLWFAGQAISLFGDGMVNVALAFAVLELGGSASALGAVLAVRTVSLVGCLLAGGVVADRTSRRAVMVGADLTRLASQGVLAVLLIVGSIDLWAVALLAGISGAATGFFNPASTGLVPAVVDPERLQEANGLRATAAAAGEILGPVAAGVLVAAAGPGWALAVDSVTFGISAVFLSRLRLPPQVTRAAASFLTDLREGWGAFRSHRWVWSFVTCATVANMLGASWFVLGPVVAEQQLGGATAWGTVLGAMGIGGLAGGLLAIRVRPQRPLLAAALAIQWYVVPLALLAGGAPAPAVALGALLAGTALMVCNTLLETTLQRHIPAETLSRVSAYEWFGSLAFQPLGLAIWGPISTGIGVSSALWLAFGLQFATTLSLFAVPEIRRLPAYPRSEPEAPGVRP
jgi:predicted MFS family arabinose efflux permease